MVLVLTIAFAKHAKRTILGAKVYITGRRMEVLENAAKSHSPEGHGQIIP